MRSVRVIRVVVALSIMLGAVPAAGQPVAQMWTGFYVGGNIGYGWGDVGANPSIPGFVIPGAFGNFPPVPGFAASGGFEPRGAFGGGQVGWNFQTGNWVFGVEADLQGAHLVSSQSASAPFAFLGGGGTAVIGSSSADFEARLDWFGTVRGRVGFAAQNFLFYATGGFAYGGVKVSGANDLTGTYFGGGPVACLPGCPVTGHLDFTGRRTQIGWALGGGVEGKTWISNLTWKLEYLYLDLGSASVSVPYGGTLVSSFGTSALSGVVSYDQRMTEQIIRVGLNYRFAAASAP